MTTKAYRVPVYLLVPSYPDEYPNEVADSVSSILTGELMQDGVILDWEYICMPVTGKGPQAVVLPVDDEDYTPDKYSIALMPLMERGEGELRMCVACGAQRDASLGRETPLKGCTSPDACTWDMTASEAAQFWRERCHAQREVIKELQSIVADLQKMLTTVPKPAVAFEPKHTTLPPDWEF